MTFAWNFPSYRSMYKEETTRQHTFFWVIFHWLFCSVNKKMHHQYDVRVHIICMNPVLFLWIICSMPNQAFSLSDSNLQMYFFFNFVKHQWCIYFANENFLSYLKQTCIYSIYTYLQCYRNDVVNNGNRYPSSSPNLSVNFFFFGYFYWFYLLRWLAFISI